MPRNWRSSTAGSWRGSSSNPANPAYHRQTTAAEILRDFAGQRLDHFVTGWGTGGTLTGVGEVLKVARPEVQRDHLRAGRRGAAAGKEWQPHKIQGWTPDFVPAVLNRDVADADPADRRRASRAIPRGGWRRRKASSSASPPAPPSPPRWKCAKIADEGAVILAMLPDTGERYFSTFLFEGVNEGSDDEWLAGLP